MWWVNLFYIGIGLGLGVLLLLFFALCIIAGQSDRRIEEMLREMEDRKCRKQ